MEINGAFLKKLIPVAKIFASIVVATLGVSSYLSTQIENKIEEVFKSQMYVFSEKLSTVEKDLSRHIEDCKKLTAYTDIEKVDRLNYFMKVNNIESFLGRHFSEFMKPDEIKFKSSE